MIASFGFIPSIFKPVLPPPFDAVAVPPVAIIVEPQLPPAASPRPPQATSQSNESRRVKADCADELSTRCRILLNQAQREIDRLRRGEDECTTIAHDGGSKLPNDRMANPPETRRLYAVDPVGTAPPPLEDPPPQPAEPSVITRPHVTNVGTLLDVLI